MSEPWVEVVQIIRCRDTWEAELEINGEGGSFIYTIQNGWRPFLKEALPMSEYTEYEALGVKYLTANVEVCGNVSILR